MTSQHTADYPTLQEVLRLPVFAGCTVCGGAAGLCRRVSGVNLTDTPDYARWLAQGELLITTGFAIADDPQAVDALLSTAAEKGLSGVGIKPGHYLPSPLPAALAEKADRLGLPLLQLPTDMRFAELADAALRMAARSETPCVTDDPAGVVRLLEESSPAETDAYIHRQLGTLLRQPEPRRQELLDTLASWLRCMGNQRRMARELHLHYNTVSYRLQQLWMLLEADPVDPMKRLALETALYLYRYRRT